GVATPVPSFPGFPAGVTSGSYDQTFDLTDPASFNPAFVTANGGTTGSAMNVLLNGLDTSTAYLNIHTSTAPAGEIRGYFSPVPEPATAGLAAIVFLAVIGQTRVRRGC
ncbi:MAG: CHRD domain-containing protein, partial [Planctomycetales bacterium]|nr:CHRD domain-containing protein [Planctomycetales bacterium]